MAKLIDYLIDEIREESENEEYDETIGLTEEEIVRYINDAQKRIHSKIVKQHPSVFIETEEINIVADQEAYSLNHKAFLNNKVSMVEYSPTGSADDYYKLDKDYLSNRDSGADGDPDRYIRRGGQILLLPTPTDASGKLRVSYVRKIKRMDKRRGSVQAVTLDSGTSTVTNLEINYVNGATVDSTELSKRTRFTVVDKYGNIKMENILLSSIDTSVSYDATLSVDSSFTYSSGETIATGDYIVPGDYATTHVDIEEEIEHYLRAYGIFKVLKRDSSVDSQEMFQELALMEEDIIQSYAEISDDISFIPETNSDDWF
jgi:hypothetical protein